LPADLAIRVGVEYVLVGSLVIDSFDNVDLALDGPRLLPERPEGWPHATHSWHGLDINDEQSLVVVLPPFQTDALAANIRLVVERF